MNWRENKKERRAKKEIDEPCMNRDKEKERYIQTRKKVKDSKKGEKRREEEEEGLLRRVSTRGISKTNEVLDSVMEEVCGEQLRGKQVDVRPLFIERDG